MHRKLKMCFSSQGSDKPLLNFCNSVFAWACMPELFLQPLKSWYVKLPLSAKLSLISRLLTPPLLQPPLYFLHLLVLRDWTLQFLFGFFSFLLHFYFMVLRTAEETSSENNAVKARLTCSSASSSLASWTFSLRMTSWLTASSCSCLMASSCFCLEFKKKSPNHKLSVTFQLRVTPGKLWQIQISYTSSEIKGKSESVYIHINTSQS